MISAVVFSLVVIFECGVGVSVTNTGPSVAVYNFAVGDGAIYDIPIDPQETQTYKTNHGATWVVWVGEDEIIATGEHQECVHLSTTTTQPREGICHDCPDPEPPEDEEEALPDEEEQTTTTTSTQTTTTMAPALTTTTSRPIAVLPHTGSGDLPAYIAALFALMTGVLIVVKLK